jgi:hypothetical protein
MSSLRQVEANRRNARLSTGPITDEGKNKSRQNAVRHGLTAETVITALEDADDYGAFELSVTSDYDAQTAVERDLVLRLASLLWRLRRATAIETRLFELQARQLLQFRKQRHQVRERQWTGHGSSQSTDWPGDRSISNPNETLHDDHHVAHIDAAPANPADGLTGSFLRLTNLPSFPLDRLSRYEATLWRQACQILFTLQCLNRRRPGREPRLR